MREQFIAAGHQTVTINTAPTSMQRGAKYYWSRLRRLYGLLRLFRLKKSDIAYCAVNSGNGVFIDLLTAAIVRLKGAKLWMHHHSFFYIETKSHLHCLLFRVAARRCRHIVLCQRMKAMLQNTYQLDGTLISTISNTNFINVTDGRGDGADPLHGLRIGFLSNVTKEKGIEEVLELAVRLPMSQFEFEIAGPIVDDPEGKLAGMKERTAKRVRWLGAVNEQQKAEFLARIDVLIFPTRYKNEAEPLVLYEAMAAGVMVIAFDRGCIRDMITPPHLLASNVDEIEQAIVNIGSTRLDRSAIRHGFLQLVSERRGELSQLVMN